MQTGAGSCTSWFCTARRRRCSSSSCRSPRRGWRPRSRRCCWSVPRPPPTVLDRVEALTAPRCPARSRAAGAAGGGPARHRRAARRPRPGDSAGAHPQPGTGGAGIALARVAPPRGGGQPGPAPLRRLGGVCLRPAHARPTRWSTTSTPPTRPGAAGEHRRQRPLPGPGRVHQQAHGRAAGPGGADTPSAQLLDPSPPTARAAVAAFAIRSKLPAAGGRERRARHARSGEQRQAARTAAGGPAPVGTTRPAHRHRDRHRHRPDQPLRRAPTTGPPERRRPRSVDQPPARRRDPPPPPRRLHRPHDRDRHVRCPTSTDAGRDSPSPSTGRTGMAAATPAVSTIRRTGPSAATTTSPAIFAVVRCVPRRNRIQRPALSM